MAVLDATSGPVMEVEARPGARGDAPAHVPPRDARYLVVFGALAGLALALIAAFNLIVDPFTAYRLWESPRLDAGKPYWTRTLAAEVVNHGPCEILVAGSSRVERGIDPYRPEWGTDAVVTMGIGGVNMHELAEACRFALRRWPPRTIVLCLDFHTFNANRWENHDFARSRFDPSRTGVDYHLGNLLSRYATNRSLETLDAWRRGAPPRLTPRGFGMVPPPRGPAQRAAFDQATRGALNNPEMYGRFTLSDDRIGLVRALARACRQRGTGLVIVMPPVHAVHLEIIRAIGLWDGFESWKRAIVAIAREEGGASGARIPVWDFTGPSAYTVEAVPPPRRDAAPMRWWWESSHFRPELGNLVIARVMGAPVDGPPLGVRLDEGSIDEHLAALRAGLDGFAARSPGERTRVESIARQLRRLSR